MLLLPLPLPLVGITSSCYSRRAECPKQKEHSQNPTDDGKLSMRDNDDMMFELVVARLLGNILRCQGLARTLVCNRVQTCRASPIRTARTPRTSRQRGSLWPGAENSSEFTFHPFEVLQDEVATLVQLCVVVRQLLQLQHRGLHRLLRLHEVPLRLGLRL